MSLKDFFENRINKEPVHILEGSIVDVLIYNKGYPIIRRTKKKNKTSHKELGMKFDAVVLSKIENGKITNVIKNRIIKTKIELYPPSIIYKASKEEFRGILKSYIGLNLESTYDEPKTKVLLPHLYETKLWDELIYIYNNSSEEEVIENYYIPILQQQYCIVTTIDNKFELVNLDIGTIFRTKLYSTNGYFNNILTIMWNKEKKGYDIFTNFNAKYNDKTIKAAKEVNIIVNMRMNDESTAK